jgi:hypothetical protein
MKHMIYVGYNVSYENTFLFGEEEDEEKNPEAFPIEDIDTIISTNEPHRQHGKVVNERSTQSLKILLKEAAHKNKTLNL